MKQLRNVSKVLVLLVLVISGSSFFVGCPTPNDNKENSLIMGYKDEEGTVSRQDITLKFENKSDVKCLISITGSAMTNALGVKAHVLSSIEKIEIGVNEKKDIILKDVPIKTKLSDGNEYKFEIRFAVEVEATGTSETIFMGIKDSGWIIPEEYKNHRVNISIKREEYKTPQLQIFF